MHGKNGINKDSLENYFYKHQIGSKGGGGGGGGEEEESEGKGERTNRIRMAAYICKHFVRSPNKVSALSPVSSFKCCKEQTYLRKYS